MERLASAIKEEIPFYMEGVREVVEEMREDFSGTLTFKVWVALEKYDEEKRDLCPLPTVETFRGLIPFLSGNVVELFHNREPTAPLFFQLQNALEDVASSFGMTRTMKGVVLVHNHHPLDGGDARFFMESLAHRGGKTLIYAGEEIHDLPPGWKLAYTGDSLVYPVWDISSSDEMERVILAWVEPTQKVDTTWRVYTRE